MRLADYLAAPRPPFDFVASDCCRWVDAWAQARGMGSPMAALGIQYDSERSALRRIAEAGGLVALWSDAMGRLGFPTTDAPSAGDIGVIVRPTACGTNEVAAIFTGDRWVSIGLRGLDFGPATVLAAWHG